jgi:DNA-directed RNA polymerase sigma subunit (sigma70/sigma32)
MEKEKTDQEQATEFKLLNAECQFYLTLNTTDISLWKPASNGNSEHFETFLTSKVS